MPPREPCPCVPPCRSTLDAVTFSFMRLSPADAPFAGRRRPLAVRPLRLEPENIAGLARERLADGVERREPDRARLAGLENREVRQRQPDPIRELGQRHPPVVE